MLTIEYIPMQYYDAIVIHFTDDEEHAHNILVDGGEINSPKYCYTDRLKGKLEEIFNKCESIDLWVTGASYEGAAVKVQTNLAECLEKGIVL